MLKRSGFETGRLSSWPQATSMDGHHSRAQSSDETLKGYVNMDVAPSHTARAEICPFKF